ncbi:MAG TPA: RNA methyltransferase [Burkholderiaceae bacterium]|nr:RNA methyltransferase [Burkholderiaceae bacterium]
MKTITSTANPSFKQWQKLATQPRAIRELGLTLAEGEHVAQAALAAGVVPQAVLWRKGTAIAAFDRLLAQVQAPHFELHAALFDTLSPVLHGIGLILLLPVSRTGWSNQVVGDTMYLDGIQDPGNAGALLRVAAAAGLKHVWASPGTTALWAPKALRAAQGAHFALDIIEQVSVEALQQTQAVHWVATSPGAEQSLWQAPLPPTPVGWMFGAEGSGLSVSAQALCRQTIHIPMCAGVESLNVASSAAVCLFERRRRATATQT